MKKALSNFLKENIIQITDNERMIVISLIGNLHVPKLA